jgi:hypothetical protein
MPRRDVLMKIAQPERKVEAPDAGATGKLERDVIPLLLDESGWATVSPFAPMVEADHPRKLHDSRDQVQDISWAIGGPDKQTNIKIAPAHQVGDVASYHLQRSDVGEGTAWSSSSRSAAASICSAKSHRPHQPAQSSDAPFHGPAALKPRSPWPARLGSHTPSGARRSSASPAHAPLLASPVVTPPAADEELAARQFRPGVSSSEHAEIKR